MHRKILIIAGLICLCTITQANTIQIPLTLREFFGMPTDKPTGSTPDPTDPNQFRASLTGTTLHIETQKDAVSYVVIQEKECEAAGEDFFYGISFGSIDCTINRPGRYTILIGCWKTDFIGQIQVFSATLYDINGHIISPDTPGIQLFVLRTSLGFTCAKYYLLP